jgi:4a-hydroxytetrahydrobiopterin dehydratase
VGDQHVHKLLPSEIERELAQLTEWRLDQGKLFREFIFPDFSRALGFMMSVALVAESMNHHPDWFNHYSTVKVWLDSHEVSGISMLDIELARKINSLLLPNQSST